VDAQHHYRLQEWEARIRAASAAWDYPMPELAPPAVWRIADEPLVSADTAAWLADWFTR
jgi:hypothetical protein